MFERKQCCHLKSKVRNRLCRKLLLFESKQLGGTPTDDVVEVSNYVSALQFGLKKLKQDFPNINPADQGNAWSIARKGKGPN